MYAFASSHLGRQRKSYRQTHGLTQRQLAKILHIHIATLRRWEKDQKVSNDSYQRLEGSY
ncbi:MAG: helix-turn-helix transcriptional regulator [Bacteroidota bacterium]